MTTMINRVYSLPSPWRLLRLFLFCFSTQSVYQCDFLALDISPLATTTTTTSASSSPPFSTMLSSTLSLPLTSTNSNIDQVHHERRPNSIDKAPTFSATSPLTLGPADFFPSVQEPCELSPLSSPITHLPPSSFHTVVFSLLLEYLPSTSQRLKCCLKAHRLLVTHGLLVIITPDSHRWIQNTNNRDCVWIHAGYFHILDTHTPLPPPSFFPFKRLSILIVNLQFLSFLSSSLSWADGQAHQCGLLLHS